MARTLSAAANSEIEHVGRLCQRLEFFANHPPQHIRALSQGESNLSYVVQTDRGTFVLRCYPQGSALCRQQELRCQHAAAARGLAPAPLCLNNHYQVLLSDYIQHGQAYVMAQHGLPLLLSALAAFHSLTVQTPVLEPLPYVAKLQLGQSAFTRDEQRLLAALQQAAVILQTLPADIVLCHMDLHAENLLVAAGKLWLLDFEYSQRADSSFDLAAISVHFALTAQQELALLEQYAALRNTSASVAAYRQKQPLAKQLYAGFCWLWYRAMPQYHSAAAQWRQCLETLIQQRL